MQYKCQECNDTGSRDKLGTYLDCNACGIAAMRRDLNDFVKSLGPTHPEDIALAIHQRALAMAPKQEAPAGWKLVPEDQTGNMFRAAAKIDNEMFAGGSSHGAEDGQIWAAMYDTAPESPVAAPTAANGAPGYAQKASPIAITDSSALNGIKWYVPPPEHLCNGMQLYFVAPQPVAAAGPDATLIDALEKAEKKFLELEHMLGGGDDEVSVEVEILTIRAALSGAKGN